MAKKTGDGFNALPYFACDYCDQPLELWQRYTHVISWWEDQYPGQVEIVQKCNIYYCVNCKSKGVMREYVEFINEYPEWISILEDNEIKKRRQVSHKED